MRPFGLSAMKKTNQPTASHATCKPGDHTVSAQHPTTAQMANEQQPSSQSKPRADYHSLPAGSLNLWIKCSWFFRSCSWAPCSQDPRRSASASPAEHRPRTWLFHPGWCWLWPGTHPGLAGLWPPPQNSLISGTVLRKGQSMRELYTTPDSRVESGSFTSSFDSIGHPDLRKKRWFMH